MLAFIALFFPAAIMVVWKRHLFKEDYDWKAMLIEYMAGVLLINFLVIAIAYVFFGSRGSVVGNINAYNNFAIKYIFLAVVLGIALPMLCKYVKKWIGGKQEDTVGLSGDEKAAAAIARYDCNEKNNADDLYQEHAKVSDNACLTIFFDRKIKKRTFCIVLTLISTASLGYFAGLRYGTSQYGMLILVFVFPALYKIYSDIIGTEKKRDVLFGGVLGLFYAFTFYVGSLSDNGDITRESLKESFIYGLLLIGTFTYIVIWIFRKVKRFQLKYNVSRKENNAKGNFFIVWAVIFLCWIPLFILCLPGTYSYDVPWQLQYFFAGGWSAHHPILHTLYMGICVKLGLVIFGSTTAGAIIHSASQMVIMSAIFSYVCTSLLKNFRIPDLAYRLLVIFFAVYPVNTVFSFTATKDVTFAGFFLLSIVFLLEALFLPAYGDAARTRLSRLLSWIKRWWKFIVSAAIMMLLRNNAFYAFIAFCVIAVFVAIIRRIRTKEKSKTTPAAGKAFLIAVVFYLCASNGLMLATGATKPSTTEMLSIPLQQIARAVTYNSDEITEEEFEAIYEILTEEGIQNYNPTLSDPVKRAFNLSVFNTNPMKYVKVYVSIGLKCPLTYINAFVEMTDEYWYPYTDYSHDLYLYRFGIRTDYYEWTSEDFIIQNVRIFPKITSMVQNFLSNELDDIPVVGLLFNVGLICWIYFGAMVYMLYSRNRFYMPFIIVFCLWLTCLLGPIAWARYMYPIIICVPPLLCLIFGQAYADAQTDGQTNGTN